MTSPSSVAQVTIYRGVHCLHPDRSNALTGEANPGDPNGTVTPDEHNNGGFSDRSPFTSWTIRREVAEYYAKRMAGGMGVILTKTIERTKLVASPDLMNEGEIFVTGQVIGCSADEVLGIGPVRQKG